MTTEEEIIHQNEHLDYQNEEHAGHMDGLIAEAEALSAEKPRFEKERFEITDAGGANWYLKQLRNLENEKATVKAQAAEILKALDADIHRLEFMFGQQFQIWVRAELDRRGGRGKTLPLLQGTAAFRVVPQSLRVLNAREALEYGKQQGWDVVKTVETLDAEGYRKEAAAALAETGEVLPGIEVVPERENFSIRYGKEKDGAE